MTTARIADHIKFSYWVPEYFGSRVLPLVREIEESEEVSVDEPVLASV